MYKMTLGNFSCTMLTPNQIKFWIENEIGKYDNKSLRAEEWCKNARIGDIYEDDFIYIEVID